MCVCANVVWVDLGHKLWQHLTPEQLDRSQGIFAWHPRPVATHDELFHAERLIRCHLGCALCRAANDEPPLQHLFEGHVDAIRLRQRPVMAQRRPVSMALALLSAIYISRQAAMYPFALLAVRVSR